MALPSLESVLKRVPEKNRHRLGSKLDSRKERVAIARSLTNWQVIAQFIPNIQDDIDSIQSDNSNLELRKIALLDMWVERNGHLATYRQLAECLYEAKAMNSLHVLCMQLGAPDQNTVEQSTSHQQTPQSQHQAPDHPPTQEHKPLPEPTLKELMTLISTDRPYDLGVHLNVTRETLNIMRANNPGDHVRQLTAVFNLYLQQADDVSWVEVAKALIAINDIRTAKNIMKEFGFTIESMEPTTTKESTPSTSTTISSGIRKRPQPPEQTTNGQKPSPDIPRPKPKHKPYINKRLGLLLIICAIGVGGYITMSYYEISISPAPVNVNNAKQETPTERSSPYVKSPTDNEGATMTKDWLYGEPTVKLIKYKDHNGKPATFDLISEIQNDCERIGSELGIPDPKIQNLGKVHSNGVELCRAILIEWINRDEEVTWSKLLEVLKNLKHGRVAKDLEMALSSQY